MEKLSVREGKWFTWGHTAGEWLRGILTQMQDPLFLYSPFTYSPYPAPPLHLRYVPWGLPSSIIIGTEISLLPFWTPDTILLSGYLLPHPFPCSSLLHLLFIYFFFGQSVFLFLRKILLSFWSRQLAYLHSNMLLCVAGQKSWSDKVRTGHWTPWRAEEPRSQKQGHLWCLILGTDIFGQS